jgi:hypothetical protein
MLEFKPINAETIIKTSEYLKYKISRTSDYTIGAMYMWRDFYDTHYTIYEGMITYKVKFAGKTSFTFPAGTGPMDKLMDLLKSYCRQNKIPLWFCTVPEEAVPILMDKYKGQMPERANRDWSDYLYLAEDLANMAGRRYSGQRNHINKFKRLYPNYSYEKFTKDNLDRVTQFLKDYQLNFSKNSSLAKEELSRSLELLPYMSKFNLIGGFIQVDDNIVAMSIGEIINDTLYCHIEKADRNYHGSYQMIVKEFVSNSINDQIKYINREEDVGDEGLRKSKLSYHPYKLLEKHCILIPS